MDRSPIRDLIVGFFVLAGLAAMAFLSISVGGYSWHGKGGLKLMANFQETGGLAVHARVVIAGVRVGEVSAIDLDTKHFEANVTMDLRPDLQLSVDTFASVRIDGLLGDRIVELSPGGDDRIFKSGDHMSHNESAVILEKVMGQIVYGLTKSDSSATKPADNVDTRPKTP